MKVAIIYPGHDIDGIGVRHIAAVLRARGVATRLIFLPREHYINVDPPTPFDPQVLAEVGRRVADCDLVGVSVMTQYRPDAIAITRAVRQAGHAKLVWGGVDASFAPEIATRYADYAVVGEGEESLPALVEALGQGEPAQLPPGVFARAADGSLQGRVAPPLEDLGALPPPAYDEGQDLVLRHGRLVTMSDEVLQERLNTLHRNLHAHLGAKSIYNTILTRGCTFKCAFCCHNTGAGYGKLFGGAWRLRFRDQDQVFDEIARMRARLPDVDGIAFSDDRLLGGHPKRILAFAERYRREVGLPFFCALTPYDLRRRLLDPLVAAGLRAIEVGLQSASERMNQLYCRRTPSRERFLQSAWLLHEYPQVTVRYDLIIEDPRASFEDNYATWEMVLGMPPSARIGAFPLRRFPGAHLPGLPNDWLEGPLTARSRPSRIEAGRQDRTVAKLLQLRAAGFSPRLLGLFSSRRRVRALSLAEPPTRPLVDLTYRAWDLRERLRREGLRGAVRST